MHQIGSPEEEEDDDPDDFAGDPKMRGRGESFNMWEDELLCDAWLATSLDPIHGTEQKRHNVLGQHSDMVP